MNVINAISGGGGGGLTPLIKVTAPYGSVVKCDNVAGTEVPIVNPAWKNLPSGYTQLDGITASGSQKINLGFAPTNHYTRVVYTNTTYVNDAHIFGTSKGAAYYHFTTYSNKYYWGRNNGEGNGGSWTSGKHTVQYNYGSTHQVIVDDVVIGSGYDIASSTNLILCDRGGTTNFKGTFHEIQVYSRSDNSLIRDLVPCMNSNNVVGLIDMHDADNPQFYTPSGTFTAGAVVPQYLNSTYDFSTTLGTHTILATLGTKSKTLSVQIDRIGIFNVEIEYIRTELECSSTSLLLSHIYNMYFYKTNTDVSVCCVGKVGNYMGSFLVSKTENGVKYSYNSSALGTITYNNETWYVSTTEYWTGESTVVTEGNYVFQIAIYTGKSYADSTSGKKEMAKDLLDYYYGVI